MQQLIDDDQLARLFEPRKRLPHRSGDLIKVGLLPFLTDENADRDLAQIGMRHADHRAFQNARLLVEERLELLGIDVNPPEIIRSLPRPMIVK
mgnify:CR=1 FL=1